MAEKITRISTYFRVGMQAKQVAFD